MPSRVSLQLWMRDFQAYYTKRATATPSDPQLVPDKDFISPEWEFAGVKWSLSVRCLDVTKHGRHKIQVQLAGVPSDDATGPITISGVIAFPTAGTEEQAFHTDTFEWKGGKDAAYSQHLWYLLGELLDGALPIRVKLVTDQESYMLASSTHSSECGPSEVPPASPLPAKLKLVPKPHLRRLGEFFDRTPFSDMEVVVEEDETSFRCHKVVLAASSKRLDSILRKCSKPSSGKPSVLAIAGFTSKAVDNLLSFLYGREVDLENEEEIGELLQLAEAYRVVDIQEALAECQLGSAQLPEHVSEHGSEYTSEHASEKASEYASEHASEHAADHASEQSRSATSNIMVAEDLLHWAYTTLADPICNSSADLDKASIIVLMRLGSIEVDSHFLDLPLEALRLLVTSHTARASELVLMEAVLTWVEHDKGSRSIDLPDLLQHIKIKWMTMDELGDAVQLLAQFSHQSLMGRMWTDAVEELQKRRTLPPANPGLLDKTAVPSTGPQHLGVVCDFCGMRPIVGMRYRSQTVLGVDCCTQCLNSLAARTCAPYTVVPEPAISWNYYPGAGQRCNICGTVPIPGKPSKSSFSTRISCKGCNQHPLMFQRDPLAEEQALMKNRQVLVETELQSHKQSTGND